MSPEEFAAETGVSRETQDRLRRYEALLLEWRPRVNLVGLSTLPDLWHRHFLDSAQLLPHLPMMEGVVDLGSGAGFPGAVLAVLGVRDVHLIEADGRKCAFLEELNRTLELGMTVHRERIEQMTAWKAPCLTSRALAPLTRLLDWAEPFIGPATTCLFPKGQSVDQELTEAVKKWNMTTECLPSRTSPTGTVLRLTGVERKHADRTGRHENRPSAHHRGGQPKGRRR
jgi:16S rRNA (guanine527-N7)-methyltransferase